VHSIGEQNSSLCYEHHSEMSFASCANKLGFYTCHRRKFLSLQLSDAIFWTYKAKS